MVEQAAGRRDQHVGAAGDDLVLLVEGDAADQEREVQLVVDAVAPKAVLHLAGELARRFEDQRARHAGAGAAVLEQRQHRQHEGRRLAGAGLREAEHVAALPARAGSPAPEWGWGWCSRRPLRPRRPCRLVRVYRSSWRLFGPARKDHRGGRVQLQRNIGSGLAHVKPRDLLRLGITKIISSPRRLHALGARDCRRQISAAS